VLVIAATARELSGYDGVVSGVGPVDAAAATARALVEERPSAVLNVGLAGAHGFDEPRIVIGREARYCDTDSRLVAASVRPDAFLLSRARETFPDALVPAIGTSARVNGSSGCDVEAMEGFAILRACELANVPALEVRVVVNEIDEPDRTRWRFEDGFTLLAQMLPRLVEALDA
jgi:nucleoside phosphorylase